MSKPLSFQPTCGGCRLPLSGTAFRLAGICLLAWGSAAFSQTLQPAGPASPSTRVAATSAAAPAKVPSRPAWSELTPQQQQALAPLASNWNTVSVAQKHKWLEISKNYGSLNPEEQAVLNSRMHEWVLLSPRERAQARLNFGKTKELSRQLTPEEKNAKWQAYQALSPEEKRKLAAKASPEPKGAATAIKPVAPQKLVKISPHASNKPGSKPALKIEPPPPAAPATPAAPLTVPGTTGGVTQPTQPSLR